MATAHLTWTAGGGVQQEVRYKRRSDASFTLYALVPGSANSIDVPGLLENVVYDFKIINKCNFGLEEESNLAPQALVACPAYTVDRGAQSLSVSFPHLGGDVDTYLIFLFDVVTHDIMGNVTLTGPFTNPITQVFDGLDPGTEYEVQVVPQINPVAENDMCFSQVHTLACPDGYTLAPDGSYCYLIEETAADPPTGGTPVNTAAATNNVYSSVGSYIYDFGYATNGVGTWTKIPLSNTFWVNGPGDGGNHSTSAGPMNRCGLWSTTTLSNQDIGFSVCLELEASSVYYIGIGGDNRCRIVIDGNVVVNQDVAAVGSSTTWGAAATFKIWHIYPVSLSAGPHIIELLGHNDSGVAALGAEIYHNTPAEIMAATSYDDLDLVFSTKDYRGQPVQLGSNDLGYVCPSGYSLAACEEPVVCRRILTALPG